MTNSTDLSNSILDAIETVVESKQYDDYNKTVKATIKTCVDPSTAKYKVTYQDKVFYAYGDVEKSQYKDGTNVYVLIPNNDESQTKLIIGAVDNLGENPYESLDEEEYYDTIGDNCIDTKDKEFCLNKDNKEIKLLDSGFISFNMEKFKNNIQNSKCDAIKIECNFTSVNEKEIGNFGLTIQTKEKVGTSEVDREYVLNTNQMTGTPYNQLNKKQYLILNIKGENLIKITEIKLFTLDLDNNSYIKVNPKDLKIYGLSRLADEEINGVTIKYNFKNGTFFSANASSSDKLAVTAELKQNQIKINEKISYIWFMEDASVDSNSIYYNSYGGVGWRCLNGGTAKIQDEDASKESGFIKKYEDIYNSYSFNVSKGELSIVKKEDGTQLSDYTTIRELLTEQFFTTWDNEGNNSFEITQELAKLKINNFKCIAIYNKNIYEKTFIINNLTDNVTIGEILIDGKKSETGVHVFSLTDKNPNEIVCNIYNKNLITNPNNTHKLKFNWYIRDIKTGFEKDSTFDIIDLHAVADKVFSSSWKPNIKIAQLTNDVECYCIVQKIEKIEENEKIKEYVLDNIISVSTKISISDYNEGYSVKIKNGNVSFVYDEQGNINLEKFEDKKITTKELYAIVSVDGQEQDSIKVEGTWTIPIKDTLITDVKVDGKSIEINEEDSSASSIKIKGTSITYSINNKYSIDKTNNDFSVAIDYAINNKTLELNAHTNFDIIKNGLPGVNGSDFVCSLEANTNNNNAPDIVALYMCVNGKTINMNKTPFYNFLKGESNISAVFEMDNEESPFKFIVKNTDGELIFDTSNLYGISTEDKLSYTLTDGGTISDIQWKILQDSENDGGNILTIDEKYGIIKINEGDNLTVMPTLIQCTATYTKVSNNNKNTITLSTVAPLIIYLIETNYPNTITTDVKKICLQSGFYFVQYDESGYNPIYTNTPFIVQSDYAKPKYSYSLYPSNVSYLQKNNSEDNYFYVKPSNIYNKVSYSQGIIAKIENEDIVATIYIPIYFYRYSNILKDIPTWDGNSVVTDAENGKAIYAPKIGAGKKNSDNTFTGVILGTADIDDKTSETGLYGFYKGKESFKLSAENGSAIFGTGENTGKIIIDPTADKSLIFSSNFYKSDNYNEYGLPKSYGKSAEANEGLLIDLSTPEIRFGSGNFSVDKDGLITANKGQIGGWTLTETDLVSFNCNNLKINDNDNVYQEIGLSSLNMDLEDKASILTDYPLWDPYVEYKKGDKVRIEDNGKSNTIKFYKRNDKNEGDTIQISYYQAKYNKKDEKIELTNDCITEAYKKETDMVMHTFNIKNWKYEGSIIQHIDTVKNAEGNTESHSLALWTKSNKSKTAITSDGILLCDNIFMSDNLYLNGKEECIHTKKKTSINEKYTGYYLGIDGLGIGNSRIIKYKDGPKEKTKTVSNIQLEKDGTIFVKNAYIGTGDYGCYIRNSSIYFGKRTDINSTADGSYLGKDGLSVDRINFRGNLIYKKYLHIAGNNSDGYKIYVDNIHTNSVSILTW